MKLFDRTPRDPAQGLAARRQPAAQLEHAAPTGAARGHSELLARSPRLHAQRRALQGAFGTAVLQGRFENASVMQLKPLVPGKLNLAGEFHPESNKRRPYEKQYATTNGLAEYWTEGQFTYTISGLVDQAKAAFSGKSTVSELFGHAWTSIKGGTPTSELHGDPYLLRAEHLLLMLCENQTVYRLSFDMSGGSTAAATAFAKEMARDTGEILAAFSGASRSTGEKSKFEDEALLAAGAISRTWEATNNYAGGASPAENDRWVSKIMAEVVACTKRLQKHMGTLGRSHEEVSRARSVWMKEAATATKKPGLWKVGNSHIKDIVSSGGLGTDEVELMSKEEFNADYLRWAVAEYKTMANHVATSPTIRDGRLWIDRSKDLLGTFDDAQVQDVRLSMYQALDTWYMKAQGRRPSQAVMLEEQGLQALK